MSRQELEMLLSDRRVELADMGTVTRYVADLHNLLNDSTLTEKKSFIKSFVSEVRVTGTEVLLAYNLPVSEGKLVNETCVVPPIVHYGWAVEDLNLWHPACKALLIKGRGRLPPFFRKYYNIQHH